MALSEIVVTSVGLPVIILAALRKIRRQEATSSEEADAVSRRVRLGLFLVSGAGLAAVLVIGFAGLPSFGHAHERLRARSSTAPSPSCATPPTSSPR